jgi:hypothetical protein
MARPLAIASAAWTVAILAAITGVLLPGDDMRLSLALFAFAMGLAMLVATVLVSDGLRHRSARRRAAAAMAQSALGRLEYLSSVTTRTRRIQWRGSQDRLSRRPPNARPAHSASLDLDGGAQPTESPAAATSASR